MNNNNKKKKKRKPSNKKYFVTGRKVMAIIRRRAISRTVSREKKRVFNSNFYRFFGAKPRVTTA